MDLQVFIKNFSEQLDETAPEMILPETKFKELDEWSSMTALTIIAMVDEQYSKKLSGTDIKNANTVEDLYDLIKNK